MNLGNHLVGAAKEKAKSPATKLTAPAAALIPSLSPATRKKLPLNRTPPDSAKPSPGME
jgi:hypothetical protein